VPVDEIVQVLEAQASFKNLVKDKIRAAVIDTNPLYRRAN
jgi:hypothetical protein